MKEEGDSREGGGFTITREEDRRRRESRFEYLYSERCNFRCRFGEPCSTMTYLKMSVKPGLNKLPDDKSTFDDIKTVRVEYQY